MVLATEKLAAALIWKAKQSVAEIGVRIADMIVAAAERFGPSGHYSSRNCTPIG